MEQLGDKTTLPLAALLWRILKPAHIIENVPTLTVTCPVALGSETWFRGLFQIADEKFEGYLYRMLILHDFMSEFT
jgi:hypothetical protein